MENNYVLMTDSDSDLPFALKQEYDIPVVSMPYALAGVQYYDDLGPVTTRATTTSCAPARSR